MAEIESDPTFEDFIVTDDGEAQLKVNQEKFRTVELRDPLEFEDDLLSDIAGPTDERGGFGASIPVKGRWIHGWLESRGEDYINNIYKNWLHFTVYVRARTRQFINTSEFSIRQGGYENMFRYILVLEDLGLASRGRSESVDLEEYDHFVPERMRTRRFVSIDTPFEEAPEEWTRPHNALYDNDEEADEEAEPVDVPVDVTEGGEPDAEDIGGQGSVEDFMPDEPVGGESSDQSGTGSLDDFAPDVQDEPDVAETPEEARIDDYPRLQQFRQEVVEHFDEAAVSAFETATIEYDEISPTDFSLGEFVIVGVWATGGADPEEDPLDIVMTIDDTNADLNPGFIPGSVGSQYRSLVLDKFGDWFKDANVTAVYNSVFKDTLSLAVAGQEDKTYYNVLEGRFNTTE